VLFFFRNNHFSTALPLLLYVVLTHGAALLGKVQADQLALVDGGLLYHAMFGWAKDQAFFSAVAATVLVFFQALQINRLTDEFRLMGERSWLPGLFYALAAACLPDFLFLSPPLVAASFVPIAMRRIFQSYQKLNGAAYVLDAALWTTVGSLFYPPMVFLLIAAIAGVFTMRTFSFKDQWVFVTGILVPLVLGWLGFFWMDQGTAFLEGQFGNLFGLYRFNPELNSYTILKAVLLAAMLLFVLLNSSGFFYRKLIQGQKSVTTLYWFMIVAGAAVLLQGDLLPAHFVLLMPSVGIFFAMTFGAMRNRMIAEISHMILLGFVLFVQYLPN